MSTTTDQIKADLAQIRKAAQVLAQTDSTTTWVCLEIQAAADRIEYRLRQYDFDLTLDRKG